MSDETKSGRGCPNCGHFEHYQRACGGVAGWSDGIERACSCNMAPVESAEAYIKFEGPVTDHEADLWEEEGRLPMQHLAEAQRAVRVLKSATPFPLTTETAITFAVDYLLGEGYVAVPETAER